jgi:membrane protein
MAGIIVGMTDPDVMALTWRQRVLQLAATLRTWPWFDTLHTLRQRFAEDRLGLTAGSLTFTTLIALVPLLTVMLALFTAFPMFSSFQGALEKYFLHALVPASIAKPVLDALTQFANKSSRLGSAGLVFLLVSALSLMLTIDRTLNGIWRVRKPRPMAQRVLVYWAAVTLGPLVLGVSLTVTSYALSVSRGLVGGMPGGVRLLLAGLEFALLAAAAAALFHYVPNTHVRWRHALAGGLFVSAGFELAKKALAWYVGSVGTFAMVYGAFATVPIFLLWIYLSWVIVLLGAVIAAYAPSLQMHLVRPPDTPGHRFALALAVLQALAQARDQARRGLDMSAMARMLRTDSLAIEPVLDGLIAHDWVARLEEEGAQRYVLLCDPAATPARSLIDQWLLTPDERVRAFRARAGFDQLLLSDLLPASPHAVRWALMPQH